MRMKNIRGSPGIDCFMELDFLSHKKAEWRNQFVHVI